MRFDDPLCAGAIGATGTTAANELAAHSGSSERIDPLPAWVWLTGTPKVSANDCSACAAEE